MLFFPKSTNFFDIFSDFSLLVQQAGSVLPKLRNGKRKNLATYAKNIRRLELQANRIRQRLSEEADSTFITPIDREDIHILARNLDAIVDSIEDLVSNMFVYEIKKDNKDFPELATTAMEATEKVHLLITLLKKKGKHIQEMKRLIHEIYLLENEGDELNKKAITNLFKTEKNAIQVVKWNELLRTLEDILNDCEDTANTVNEILIKNF